MRNYIELIKTYPRPLAFGFLHSSFSILGQTFLISLFVPHIRESFQLQRTGFGTLYSIATFAAACLLPFAGRLIDKYNLRIYSFAVGLLMVTACWVTASARLLPVLFFGLFALRFSGGDGLLNVIEASSVSRYFGSLRGKALGITSMGYLIGTAVFPVIAVFLILHFGWRTAYFLLGFLCMIVFLPLTVWLLRNENDFPIPPPPRSAPRLPPQGVIVPHMGRREVLRSPYFYCVLPLLLFSPFFLSGFMVHQASFAAYKGWNHEWIAYFLVGFSISGGIATFGTGPLVDRFTARALLPFLLLPMGTGTAILALSRSPVAGAIFFVLIGLGMGAGRNIRPAVWAEVYGTRNLGAIRSLESTFVVFAASLSPGITGWILDRGMKIDHLLFIAVATIAAVSALSAMAPKPKSEKPGD